MASKTVFEEYYGPYWTIDDMFDAWEQRRLEDDGYYFGLLEREYKHDRRFIRALKNRQNGENSHL